MKTFLRKKLIAALVAGCSVIAFNAVSFAADSDAAPVTAAHEQAAADFDKATLPADPGKALYEKHLQAMHSDYAWMTDDTAKRAAMAFTAIDKAAASNKIDAAQAKALQEAVIGFYQENQQYAAQYAAMSGDAAKAYALDYAKCLQLNQNLDELAQKSGVPENIVAEILTHKSGESAVKRGSRDQRAAAFLGQLVKQQKLSSEEANSLIAFMTKSHEQFAKMNDEQRQAYREKVKAMSEDERYAELAKGTNIPIVRLKEIFTVMRDEIKAQAAANEKIAAQQP